MEEYIKHNVFEKSVLFDEIDTHCLDVYATAYKEGKCPICMSQLNKIPKVSCKCKHCKNTVYVRISPFANQRLLLDEKGVWKLDYIRDNLINRRFVYKMVDVLNSEDENFTDEILQRRALSGKTYDEILVDEFYKHASYNAKNCLLGLMRNNFLHIAYILRRYDSVEKTLQIYFAVMFVDILGYINEGFDYCNEVSVRIPYQKHPEYSFVAPGVLDDIIKILGNANYRIDYMYETYRKGVFKLPIKIEEDDVLISWWKIKDIIKDRIDSKG